MYSSLDGKNPLGWEWKLPVILLRTCWGGSQARGGHEAMHEMVGVGRNGVRAEMDGDHYRPC